MSMDREVLLQEVLRLPWRTVLARPLVPRQDQPKQLVSALTCAMTVRGGWCGRLMVSCDRSLVETLARRLQGKALPHDQVQAMHWLTTALGGALRLVLPAELGFGFPTVVDHEPSWARVEPTIALHFTSGVCALSIALFQAPGANVGSPGGNNETPSSDDAANDPPLGAYPFAAMSPLTGT